MAGTESAQSTNSRFGNLSSGGSSEPRRSNGWGAGYRTERTSAQPRMSDASLNNGDDNDGSKKTIREPKVVNSRAAGLGTAPSVRKESLRREDESSAPHERRSYGSYNNSAPPPPQPTNSRFAKLALADNEDRDRDRDRDSHAMGGGGSYGHRDRDRDRDSYRSSRDQNNQDRGPPPQQQSSRFAAAAREFESERADYESSRPNRDSGGGPPQVQRSRFANAANMDYEDRQSQQRDRGGEPQGDGNNFSNAGSRPSMEVQDRSSNNNNNRSMGMSMSRGQPSSGGAAMSSGGSGSRWGNVSMDRDSNPNANRSFGGGYGGAASRGAGENSFNGRSGGGYSRSGGSGGYNSRGSRFGDDDEPFIPRFPGDRGDSLNRSAAPPVRKELIMKPKKKKEAVLPPVSVPLTLPGEDEEAAKLRIEKKKREEAERKAKEEEEARLAAQQKAEAERKAKEDAKKAEEMEGDIISVFINETKKMLGAELKDYIAEQKQANLLPPVETLVYSYLKEVEGRNPDIECKWASKEERGDALLSLVADDIMGQVQILWAVQRYCDWLGFPKLNNEYLVQTMFTNMYKYDLADGESFDAWKEDDSDEHEVGKQKCLVQTIDWFNWLEEDDEEELEDDEEYDEY